MLARHFTKVLPTLSISFESYDLLLFELLNKSILLMAKNSSTKTYRYSESYLEISMFLDAKLSYSQAERLTSHRECKAQGLLTSGSLGEVS